MSEYAGKFDQQWQPCPRGTLSQVANHLKNQRAAQTAIARRNVLTGVVAAVAIVLGAGMAAWETGQQQTVEMVPVSQIQCEQAQNIIPRLFTRQVSREEGASIRYHLDICPRCSKLYYHELRERGFECESQIP